MTRNAAVHRSTRFQPAASLPGSFGRGSERDTSESMRHLRKKLAFRGLDGEVVPGSIAEIAYPPSAGSING